MANNPITNRLISMSKQLTAAKGSLPTVEELATALKFDPSVVIKHLGSRIGQHVSDPPKPPESAKTEQPAIPPEPEAQPLVSPLLAPLVQPKQILDATGKPYRPITERFDYKNLIVHGTIDRVGAADLPMNPAYCPPNLKLAWCMNPAVKPDHQDWYVYTQEQKYIVLEPEDVTFDRDEARRLGKVALRSFQITSVYGKQCVGLHPYILVGLPMQVAEMQHAKFREWVNSIVGKKLENTAEDAANDPRNVHKVAPEQILGERAEIGEGAPVGIATTRGLSTDDPL